MKRILLVMMVIFMVSCETENARVSSTDIKVEGRSFTILEMDGCQYIASYLGGNSGVLAHRGMCKFCEEKEIKQIDSIVKANLNDR